MLESIFAPYADLGPLILRIGLALVFIAHGWPKLNPNSEMKGIAGMTGFLKQLGVPLPTFFAWVVTLLETVGAILLILGLGTRILALGFAIDMLVAIYLVKLRMMKAGFSGQNGWEFEFALLVGSLALLFTGAGSISLDAAVGL
jgi:putative oxidoreductase